MTGDRDSAKAIGLALAAVLVCITAIGASVRGEWSARLSAAPAAVQVKPAASDPWYGRTKGAFQTVRAPDQRFQFECPNKDWTIVGAAGPVPVVAISKKGEVFVVERSPLNRALEPADITDLFVQLETETIKEHLPQASQFQARIIEVPDRRVVAIEFNRPAPGGIMERARQYSIATGKDLYRLTCASATASVPAFQTVCAHMVASFAVQSEQ